MAEPTVAVLGLGLVGGSLARDLSGAGHRVLGHDRNPSVLRDAVAEGCVHAALGDGHEGIGEADVVVLAVPVGSAPGLLAELAPRLRATLVTDVGSTKRSIVAAAVAAGLADRFVGSHPLAGDHRSGLGASRAGLFAGARVFVCPAPGASPEALERAEALWRSVGAEPHAVDAAGHDARMAWISHLPQAAASALGMALAGSGFAAGELGPGGRDATRLAASSPGLWTDVLLDNADLVEPALATLEASLGELRAAVLRRDAGALGRMLSGAKAWKEGVEEEGV